MKKKYSGFNYFLNFVGVFLMVYFTFTCLVWVLFLDCSFKAAFRQEFQVGALVLLYWWIPIIRMCDMEEEENACK